MTYPFPANSDIYCSIIYSGPELDISGIFYLDSIIIVVEEKDSGSCHLLSFHHRLQVGQEGHVLGHVSGKDHVNHHLSEVLPLFCRQAKNWTKTKLNYPDKFKIACINFDVIFRMS